MKRIVVYGLGNMGRKIAKELLNIQDKLDVSIVALMDKSVTGLELGHEVLKPDDLKQLQYDNILITSEKRYVEIKTDLITNYCVSDEKLIHLGDLLSEGEYYCNLCDHYVPFMLDTGIDSEVFSKRKIIGGGRRKNCVCPICGGADRERWVRYVLINELHIDSKEARILHFAPEEHLEHIFRKCANLDYITADIEEGRADIVEDITNISFESESFDYIICNHVMEHIADEEKAFSELKRCVKKDGKIIFSVPICWEIDTYEDKNIVTEEERLNAYGQKDHVRLYGKDIAERLKEYGFQVECYKVSEILPRDIIEKMRLISEDTTWILQPL